MQNLTFEQLPAAAALLLEKIERIEKLLSGMEDKKPSEYLDISKAAAYLDLTGSYGILTNMQKASLIYENEGGQ